MNIDYRKTTVVRLWKRENGCRAEFDILVYGYTAKDLSVTGHPVIQALAERYPEYTGSPFGLQTLHGKELATRPRSR